MPSMFKWQTSTDTIETYFLQYNSDPLNPGEVIPHLLILLKHEVPAIILDNPLPLPATSQPIPDSPLCSVAAPEWCDVTGGRWYLVTPWPSWSLSYWPPVTRTTGPGSEVKQLSRSATVVGSRNVMNNPRTYPWKREKRTKRNTFNRNCQL